MGLLSPYEWKLLNLFITKALIAYYESLNCFSKRLYFIYCSIWYKIYKPLRLVEEKEINDD